jgi:hypothetical protein
VLAAVLAAAGQVKVAFFKYHIININNNIKSIIVVLVVVYSSYHHKSNNITTYYNITINSKISLSIQNVLLHCAFVECNYNIEK